MNGIVNSVKNSFPKIELTANNHQNPAFMSCSVSAHEIVYTLPSLIVQRTGAPQEVSAPL